MDRYDEQIEEIKAGVLDIKEEWEVGNGIFKFLTDNPDDRGLKINGKHAGCLTMIKNNPNCTAFIDRVEQQDFIERVRADERMPHSLSDTKQEQLPLFAEYQREFDKLVHEYNNLMLE